ncbi:MAG: FKBP-type peptidyl-prolyl cis-trans isomerase [Microbacterium sp.]
MRIRPLVALSTVALSGLLLAGCSSAAEPDPTATSASVDLCAAAAESGAAAEAVTVSGDFGAEPTVTFAEPTEVAAIERKVVTEGTGDQIQSGDLVSFAVVAYDAETGEKLGSAGFEEGTALPTQVTAEGNGQFFGCATVGTRFVLALPGSDDAAAQINVVDVLGITPAAAWGEEQAPVDGMPTVTLADDGTPTVTIPDTDAPTELELAVLKKGDGLVVEDGDAVLVQYTGWSWDTKENFDSSWSRGQPSSFSVAEGSVYEGFRQAIIGQAVGSQVLVVMPPELGDTSGDLKGQTLVFVVDILAVQHATSD